MTHDPREALEPCPFCGGEAERIDVPTVGSDPDLGGDPNAGGSCIQCKRCTASTALHFDRKENLYSSWNDRMAGVAEQSGAGAPETSVRCGAPAALTASPGEQKPPPAAGQTERELAAQAALARVRKVRDGYANQAKFADVDQASYFREFVRRLDDAVNPKPSAPPWNGAALRRESPAPDGVAKIGPQFDISQSEPEMIWDSDDCPDAGGGVSLNDALSKLTPENIGHMKRVGGLSPWLEERKKEIREALSKPAPVAANASAEAITEADIRAHVGDGMVSMQNVIDAANAILATRASVEARLREKTLSFLGEIQASDESNTWSSNRNSIVKRAGWLAEALSVGDETKIGNTVFCGHSVMASICELCGDEAKKSEGGKKETFMTEDQIEYMVNRFLGWKLPANFNPDNGVSFNPIAGEGGPHPFRREPSGTNLLDATQADAMVRYMIDRMPPPPVKALSAVGDEAKKSEGIQSAYGEYTPITVRASTTLSSPTADRREIVAQSLKDHGFTADAEGMLLNCGTRGAVDHIFAILAALDGGAGE